MISHLTILLSIFTAGLKSVQFTMIAATSMSYLCWRMVSHEQLICAATVILQLIFLPDIQKNLIHFNILNFKTVMTTRVRYSLLLLLIDIHILCLVCLLYLLFSLLFYILTQTISTDYTLLKILNMSYICYAPRRS